MLKRVRCTKQDCLYNRNYDQRNMEKIVGYCQRLNLRIINRECRSWKKYLNETIENIEEKELLEDMLYYGRRK